MSFPFVNLTSCPWRQWGKGWGYDGTAQCLLGKRSIAERAADVEVDHLQGRHELNTSFKSLHVRIILQYQESKKTVQQTGC